MLMPAKAWTQTSSLLQSKRSKRALAETLQQSNRTLQLGRAPTSQQSRTQSDRRFGDCSAAQRELAGRSSCRQSDTRFERAAPEAWLPESRSLRRLAVVARSSIRQWGGGGSQAFVLA